RPCGSLVGSRTHQSLCGYLCSRSRQPERERATAAAPQPEAEEVAARTSARRGARKTKGPPAASPKRRILTVKNSNARLVLLLGKTQILCRARGTRGLGSR